MAKYIWKDGCWRDPEGKPMEMPRRSGPCMPNVMPDLPGYFSVVTNKWVEGRRARRYDLESSGSRPLEPDEGPKFCTSKKWAKRLGLEWNNDPGAGRPKHWSKDFSSNRIETQG